MPRAGHLAGASAWVLLRSSIVFRNTSHRIDTTIERWFAETVKDISGKVVADTPVDNLCTSVVPLTHKYCTATLLLLNNPHRLPAMALLR